MTLLRKAGSGSVDPVIFNDVVDAEQNGGGGVVTAADIDSQAASNGDVLTADGAGNALWEASPAPSFATPAVALGAAAAAGVASTVIRSDSTIVAFDSTSPTTQAFGDAAVVGTASVAARRDHKHAMPAAPTSVSGNAGTATALQTGRTIDGVTFDGTANITTLAEATHAATSKTTPADADELPLVDSAASNVLKKLTWANLKATIKAYTDTLYPSGSGTSSGTNTGDVAFATNAVVLGTAAAAGAASTVMRSNDTIAAFDATSPSTQAFSDSAVVGVATVAARRDHKHAMPALGTGASNACAGNDSRLSDSRAPSGTASGSLAGSYPSPRVAPGKTGERTLMQSLVATCLAEAFPRWAINSNTALLSSARLSSVAIPVLQGTACTNVSFVQATTAFTGASNAWFALTDAAFNVIRQSTDQLAAGIAQNTVATLPMDSIPVTAGARAASTTVTLTIPTLSESLTSLVANGDSIVVANANIAAYNGTFTVVSVSSTQITYVSGGSASDSLAAPFPTVKLASGKRVYTAAADALVYAVIMLKGTVGTQGCFAGVSAAIVGSLTPILASSGNTGLTGTCPSPISTATTGNVFPWAAIT